MEDSTDMVFGADYAGADTSTASGIWASLPSISDVIDKLGTAGLTRAAYEINRPVINAGVSSPLGTFGKVGTVGVELGTGTQTLIMLLAVGVGIYLLTR